MARELQEVNSSGEITGINLGGATAGDAVTTKDEQDTALALKQDIASLNTDIDTHLADGTVPEITTAILTSTETTKLANTDVQSLTVNTSQQMLAAIGSSYEGSYMRIGISGVVGYSPPQADDVNWQATNATDIALTQTLQDVPLTPALTIDQDIGAGEGSYEIILQVENEDANVRTITVQAYYGGVALGAPMTQDISTKATQLLSFTGFNAAVITLGSDITIEVSSSANAGQWIRGLAFATRVSVTKFAQYVEPATMDAAIAASMPPFFDYAGNLGAALTEAEIIMVTGGTVPPGRPFWIKDYNRLWTCFFDGSSYWSRSLTRAT